VFPEANYLVAYIAGSYDNKNVTSWRYDYQLRNWTLVGNALSDSQLHTQTNYWSVVIRQPTAIHMWIAQEVSYPQQYYLVAGYIDSYGDVGYIMNGTEIFPPPPQPPIPMSIHAAFTYTVDGCVVYFTDKSYGGAVQWIWNFGDNYGSTSQNPTHKYASSGTYTVSLTVFDAQGQSNTARTKIEIALGPGNPISQSNQGWDIYITPDLTVSVSAFGLLVGGAIMCVSAIYLPSIPVITPKGRKLLGVIMMLAGVYYFVFVNNSWWA
jgi:PKD repeat protein